MENKKLSQEAKERIKKNIDLEIDRYEEIYELLSEKDKEALRIGKEAIMKKERNRNKIGGMIKRIFQKK